MTNSAAAPPADEAGWISRWLNPGDLYRGEPLTDQQAGIELFDGTIYVDNQAGLAALGHTLIHRFDSTDTGTSHGPGPDDGHTHHSEPSSSGNAITEPTVVYLAITDTSRYSWTGIGATADQARDALMSAWYTHADATGADPDHIRREELNVIHGTFGQGFRDWDLFTGS